MGVGRLLEFIAGAVPAPNEMPGVKTTDGKVLKCKSSDPTSALYLQDHHRTAYRRGLLLQGLCRRDRRSQDMINPARNSSKERVSQLFVMNGKNREKVEKLVAGDIGATIKMKNVLYQQYP